MTAGLAVVVVVVVVVVVGPKSRSLIRPKVFDSSLPVNVELSSCETVSTWPACSLLGFEETRMVPELQRLVSRKSRESGCRTILQQGSKQCFRVMLGTLYDDSLERTSKKRCSF